jgi:hypothetical protein
VLYKGLVMDESAKQVVDVMSVGTMLGTISQCNPAAYICSVYYCMGSHTHMGNRYSTRIQEQGQRLSYVDCTDRTYRWTC